ncbi:hypothetical protein [uncultured Winogradskyella sp.]|uniref:hypothetical protein n=1 Tax=uncultured Winogradskyella sp. TaxID=395353 RepID=UPI00261D3E1B|nr:hypothetical protein [uncultured Winogradskyella sp.]
MKNYITTAIIFLLALSASYSQQEKGIIGYDNWLDSWTEFRPSHIDYNEPTEILSGDISENTTLSKRNTYLLLGDVFVTNNATLIIEPGTVILGDFKTKGSLTISKGSKIIAEGTQTDPIIFTSSKTVKKPGDWGGIFVLGNAPINNYGNENSINYGLRPTDFEHISYGGNNKEDNSGILKYVRVEFAGKRTKEFGNFNGITLAGVGRETVLYNVMVSYCEGTAFNIMGGDLVLVKLVSYKNSQNDYKFNYGTQCNITNSLAIRNPYISSPEGSGCLYVSSYDKKEDADPAKNYTTVSAENITLVNISNDLENDINIGLVQEAIYIGNDTSFVIDKSVISGFNPAVMFDRNIVLNDENLRKIKFVRTYFNNCNGNIYRTGFSNNDDLESWYGSRAFNNLYSKGPDSETFIDATHNKYPDYRLKVNKIIASNDYFDDENED